MTLSAQLNGWPELKRLLEDLKTEAPKVRTNALNAGGSTMKTQAAKEIGAELNLTAATIKSKMDYKKASYTTDGKFTHSDKAPTWASYGAKPTKTGVKVKYFKKGSWYESKSAFYQTMKGSYNVFKRFGPPRLPVYIKTGPNPVSFFELKSDTIFEKCEERITSTIEAELARIDRGFG